MGKIPNKFLACYQCVMHCPQQFELIILWSDTKYLAIYISLTWYEVGVHNLRKDMVLILYGRKPRQGAPTFGVYVSPPK